MAKVANTDTFKNFPGWKPVEKHKNYGQNQKASNMEPFGGNLWHCALVRKSIVTWSNDNHNTFLPRECQKSQQNKITHVDSN